MNIESLTGTQSALSAYQLGNLSILARYAGLSARIKILNGKQPHKTNPYNGKPGFAQNYTPDAPLRSSVLNTPIFSDLTILGGQWFDTSKPMKVDPVTGNVSYPVTALANDRSVSGNNQNSQSGNTGNDTTTSFYMQFDTVLITMHQAKEIIRTQIQGKDGRVKEYIGMDDFDITINGIITGNNGVNPKEEARRLKLWLDAPISLPVTSWWLQNMDIHNVVVYDYDIPQIQGGYSYQVFTIKAYSDKPVNLYISQSLQNG